MTYKEAVKILFDHQAKLDIPTGDSVRDRASKEVSEAITVAIQGLQEARLVHNH